MTTTTTTTSTSRPSNADVPEPSYAPSAPPDGMGTWHAWARGTHSVCVCCARDESRRWCHRRCGANGGVVPMAVWCRREMLTVCGSMWRPQPCGGVLRRRRVGMVQRIWWERVLGCVRACGAWRVRSKPAVRCGAARSSSGGCGACGSGGGACSRCCPVSSESTHDPMRGGVVAEPACGALACGEPVRGAWQCAVHGGARCMAVRGASRCIAVRGAWRCAGCVAI